MIVALAATAVLAAGTGTAMAAPAAGPGAGQAGASGTFERFEPGASAVAYDTELVPEGADVQVRSVSHPSFGTLTFLVVRGLVPERNYGAHVHVNSCGKTGDAAGPHYQDERAPEGSTGDPRYANADNEVWLDLHTDSDGVAVAHADVDWAFRDDGANSVVIHEKHTSTEHGIAGDAGARLGCLSVDF